MLSIGLFSNEYAGSAFDMEDSAVFIVRLAINSDIEQILGIDPSAQSKRTFLQAAIDQGECFVVDRDQDLLSYGVMDHRFFGRCFVHQIYVDASHRRLGVASRLFLEFEEQCKSSRIFTSTNLSNLPMQGFLASRGYVSSGVVQYLDEGDPEMFYSKSLR
jgi:ribosomal protein S18 acetylase RimI-like enzyme